MVAELVRVLGFAGRRKSHDFRSYASIHVSQTTHGLHIRSPCERSQVVWMDDAIHKAVGAMPNDLPSPRRSAQDSRVPHCIEKE